MPKPYDSRIADKFVIRLTDGLRDRIAKISKDHHRSMNAEMVMALEAYVAACEADPDHLVSAPSNSLDPVVTHLIEMVQDELGERTQERRDADTKRAISAYRNGAGLPQNAMEVIVRGAVGIGKTTVINALHKTLQDAINMEGHPMPAKVYMTMSGSTVRGLEQVAERHERVVFLTDEMEQC